MTPVKKLRYFSFAVIPLLVLVMVLVFNQARGPYYNANNADPSYILLLNSLNVACLDWVTWVDNPASTALVVGGVTIRITGWLEGVDDLEAAVLLDPEYYLDVINWVFMGINLLSLLAFGLIVFRLTGSFLWGMFFQSIPFVSWQEMIRVFVRVTPEAMSFFASMAFVLVLLRIACYKDLEKRSLFYTVLFAVVIAFGTATKLTFLPLALIPFILLPSMRLKLLMIVMAGIIFHVLIIPAWGHYQYFINWGKWLFTNFMRLGERVGDAADSPPFRQIFTELLFQYQTFFLMILAATAVVIVFLLKGDFQSISKKSVTSKMLLASILTIIAQLLIVSMHFGTGGTWYFIPYFTLTPLIIFLMVRLWKEGFTYRLGYLQQLLLVVFLAYHFYGMKIPSIYSDLRDTRDNYAATEQFVGGQYDDYARLMMIHTSSKYWALKSGGSFSLPQQHLYSRMQELFADEKVYFLEYWKHRPVVLNWKGEPKPLGDFLDLHKRVILQGNPGTIQQYLFQEDVELLPGIFACVVYGGDQMEWVYVIEDGR